MKIKEYYTIVDPSQEITKSRKSIAKYVTALHDGVSQVTLSCTHAGLWIVTDDPMQTSLIQCNRDQARELVGHIAPGMTSYPDSHPEGLAAKVIGL